MTSHTKNTQLGFVIIFFLFYFFKLCLFRSLKKDRFALGDSTKFLGSPKTPKTQ